MRRVLILFVLLAAGSLWAVDPSRKISHYSHTAWRSREGYFSGFPLSITQTTDGYLWIDPDGGLVRFDGARFVPWPQQKETRSSLARIESVFGARDGSLWMGGQASSLTSALVQHWANHEVVTYELARGSFVAVGPFVEDSDGAIWFLQENARGTSLCRVAGREVKCYGKADGIPETPAYALVQDKEGYFWIGTLRSVIRWKPGSSQIYDVDGLKSRMVGLGVSSLAVAPDNSIWVGISASGTGLGLRRLSNGVWHSVTAPGFDGSTLVVTSLFLDRENALWIGTGDQGVYRLYGDSVDHFQAINGLSSDYVLNFYEDHEGGLWIATTGGLDRLRDVPVASLSAHNGLCTGEPDSVLATRDGAVWVGGDSALCSLRGNRIFSVRTGKGLPGQQVTALFEDHAGNLWVGIDNTLNIYKDGKFRLVMKLEDSSPGMIVGMAEDVEGNIWAQNNGKTGTLYRIRDKKVVEKLQEPPLPRARQVVEDPKGGIWLGEVEGGGLVHYRNGHIESFPSPVASNSRIGEITVNADGSVLRATTQGVIGWKNGKQQLLNSRNGLPCDAVNYFVFDNNGALWLYMGCGLAKIEGMELKSWWGNPDIQVQFRFFDSLDGVEPGWAPFNGVAKASDGKLFFVNRSVLQVVDPDHLAVNTVVPPVNIENIVADRKNYSPDQNLHLPPLTRDLEIDYTALSLAVPQKVRFRYQLEGRDKEWQDPGTRRQAFYTDLRPGTYRFRVIACNNDGVWNEQGASLDFTVAPAWYQTRAFVLLGILVAGVASYLFYRLRMRQVARLLSTRFDERLAERTRVARELHDTLLQTVQGSKLVADDAMENLSDVDRMRRAMGQLSLWLGRAVDEGRAALNSLRASTTEKNNLAEAFRGAIEDCRRQYSIEASFSVAGQPQELHPMLRDEIYRIGYEAIINACAHSGGNHMEVALNYANDLTVRVQDNGKGIDPSLADKGKEGHFGLQGMRERADRIGAKLAITSSPGSGTEIVLFVPGRIVFRHIRASAFNWIKNILSPTDRSPDANTN